MLYNNYKENYSSIRKNTAILDAVASAVIPLQMDKVAHNVQEGVRIIHESGASFETITHFVREINKQLFDVSATSQQMSASTQQVSASVEDLLMIAKVSLSRTEEVSGQNQPATYGNEGNSGELSGT
ncbi:hypothetical protein [Paenibacillus agricola]|uniref:Methyl-accepting transducer domain-containing protein n=1 Tax=Paenibacillus agricola TaxID=2716264 RepID=A0ABX0J9B0_9BACL|nr:hypothetical protein [Paenibacillus agricola]NHN31452.1 hypothetical protein [Paenibacillus agricola]